MAAHASSMTCVGAQQKPSRAVPSSFSFLSLRSCLLLSLLLLLVSSLLATSVDAAEPVVITCPTGWSLYSSTTARTCVRAFTNASVLPAAVEATCTALVGRTGALTTESFNWPFAPYVHPHAVAVHDAEENAFARQLLLEVVDDEDVTGSAADAVAMVLGGVAGYGEVQWYADVDTGRTSTYTNFAEDADWEMHAGTVLMRPSGRWSLLQPSSQAVALPYACAFDASASVILPDTSSSSNSAASSSSTASTVSPASSSSSSSNSRPTPNFARASRPAVPQPAPDCLPGWTALPSTVDMSEGASNTVCYRLFAEVTEVGGRLGKTFADAESHCSAVHPKATLASIMSAEENAWVTETLLSELATPTACHCLDSNNNDDGNSPSATSSARTVFLGGAFMKDGSSGGILGNWYADQYLFDASANAGSSPSSPAWPTAENRYFSNWESKEPALSYGVVGLLPPQASTCNCVSTAAGRWVALDLRSTQPFLCSYLNDGSIFPEKPTTTIAPNPSNTPAPQPSDYCLPGWSYLAAAKSCYRLFPNTQNEITVSTIEDTCEGVLQDVVVTAKIDRVHAVSMQTLEESYYVGALLRAFLEKEEGSAAAGEAVEDDGGAAPVTLAGISFIDSGAGGFYVSGVRTLDEDLALSLWAAMEPIATRGCVAVDVQGRWHYVPCSQYTSSSMPANTAVQVRGYTCQYSAKEIDPVADLVPIMTTTTTTAAPSGSSSSGSWGSDNGNSGDGFPDLGERIVALSGATHLVVAAGSTGVYTLQGPEQTAPAAASVRGLHLYFAPLPAFYGYAVPEHGVDGTVLGGLVHSTMDAPTSLEELLSLTLSEDRPFAPCEGYKDQARISRVRANMITVRHANVSEVGYVCISKDGITYRPTRMTYEIVDGTLRGFIPAAARAASSLPPLFCGSTWVTTDETCAVQKVLSIPEHSSGSVQLALRDSTGSAAEDVVVGTGVRPAYDTTISHVRLSAGSDCMSGTVAFNLLESEIEVRQVSAARYTRGGSKSTSEEDEDGENEEQYSIFSYQYASAQPTQLAAIHPLYNSSAAAATLATLQAPATYYVCVAVQKPEMDNSSSTEVLEESRAASRRLLGLWNITSAAGGTDMFSVAHRLAARTSLSPSGAAVRTYTAVPGLKAQLVPPAVSLKGMWALPPRRLAEFTDSDSGTESSSGDTPRVSTATLIPAAATYNRSAHYRLRPTYVYTYGANSSEATNTNDVMTGLASAAQLHIPQYSSPIILLDGHDLRPGMLALLSQDPASCNRLQPLPTADPSITSSTWPAYVDTMIPISSVDVLVESNASSSGARSVRMAYMQLNLNHTGLWGHHPTRVRDDTATTQVWYVCIAQGPLSPFVSVRAPSLTITVHRLAVRRFLMDSSAAFTSSDAAEPSDTQTTHLNLNTGFAGMLWMHGVDVRLWTTATLHSAQIAFAVVLPSAGTDNDTAVQCASTSLFYAQRGLGLLTPEGSQLTSTEPEVSVGMVIPLGFFAQQTSRRMQLCLSVPLPFVTQSSAVQKRHFAPVVDTTLDVRPIQLLYMGRYSSIPSSSDVAEAATTATVTLVRVAEGARDIVLPLTGYGIRPDMTVFLSSQLCRGTTSSATSDLDIPSDATHLVEEQSALNMSVVALYDLPSAYWADVAEEEEHRPRVFVVLRHEELLHRTAAEALFKENVTMDAVTGVVTRARVPLNVCLYAPGTAQQVFATNFQVVVDRPKVLSIHNLASDAAFLSSAKKGLSLSESPVDSAATVVYAANMDLLVEGFGLDDTNTYLMPARDCRNVSSFLWRAPVQLSALPSSRTTTVRVAHMKAAAAGNSATTILYPDADRYSDPQTSYSSWFVSLQQAETVRFGANADVGTGTYVGGFEWCVRMTEAETTDAPESATTSTTTTGTSSAGSGSAAATAPTATLTVSYVSTGIPYQLLIPAIDGFVLDNARHGSPPSTLLSLPTQHPTLGRWYAIQLTGPVIDILSAIGSPLYTFLAPEAYTCAQVKNSYLGRGLEAFGNATFAMVNGSAVLLPRWLSSEGNYRLCASALYPTLASAEFGVEAALQFVAFDGLRVQLNDATYGVFSMNHTTTVTVQQGQEWTLPISGSMLTNRSRIRFQTSVERCGEAMVATRSAGGFVMPDINIQEDFSGFALFGQEDAASEEEGGASVVVSGYYVVLSQSLIRGLKAPATYVLCLQPQSQLPWQAASAITLVVEKHVRQPTHYQYFPADGSEDVAALTALAPTKVALSWNTGESSTVNIVGATRQQVSLALWCFPKPSASTMAAHRRTGSGSSSVGNVSSDAVGVEEELVPCGDHRRVMFVKPLSNDADPCFVDAEAVTDDVVRGPYVLDFGVLTLPHALSAVDDTSSSSSSASTGIIPNMTQPWMMCLEVGAERWREPTYPKMELQYTRAIPTGFRLTPDDASNTTAPFPAHRPDVEATTTADVDRDTGLPLGGNTTLVLYAQDSSHVVYLNGYGIERGHKIRFGTFCAENMPMPSVGETSTTAPITLGSGTNSESGNESSESNSGAAADTAMSQYLAVVADRQDLANPRLYAQPLTIDDDNGVFLVPSTHIAQSEDPVTGILGVPMCLSTDDGATFTKTTLRLRVLPSRLLTDTETKYRNLLEQVLANTLLVPQHSRGSVDLTALVKDTVGGALRVQDGSMDAVIPFAATTTTSSTADSSSDDTNEEKAGAEVVFLPIGTQVLLSDSCRINTVGLPLLTVTVPNVITLTEQHTAAATSAATGRLKMCFRDAISAAKAAAAGNAVDESAIGAVTKAFLAYGLYYRVLRVQVAQVSTHAWTPSLAMAEENIRHIVMRRGAAEDLLLPVQLTANTATTTNVSAEEDANVTTSSDGSDEDTLLGLLEQSPATMSLLSLPRFYLGRPCFRAAAAASPVSAVSPHITSYAGMQLRFSADSVAAAPLLSSTAATAAMEDVGLGKTLVAALPSERAAPHFPVSARGSVCFSVDGGLHYYAIGVAHLVEDWAPTLEAAMDLEDTVNAEEAAEAGGVDNTVQQQPTTTTNIRVYAQSSATRQLRDTRFVDPATLTSHSTVDERMQAELGQLATALLWAGFIGRDGFATDGVLYLPAASSMTQTGTATPVPLLFSLDNRLQSISTNLSLTVVSWSLTCFGNSSVNARQQLMLRQTDSGVQVATVPGACSTGVRDGIGVRAVPLSLASCDSAAAVDAAYVMDFTLVQPRTWGAATTAPMRVMQVPMAVRYVPEGDYALCLRQDLPFHSSISSSSQTPEDGTETEIGAVIYAATPLRLHVSARHSITSVGGVGTSSSESSLATSAAEAAGIVLLPQRSAVRLPVSGSAVGLDGVPLLFALAPADARTVQVRRSATSSRTVSRIWSKGCAEVQDVRDPTTGASLLVSIGNGANTINAVTSPLAAIMGNVQDGLWHMDAAHLSSVEWLSATSNSSTSLLASYDICFSMDGGLTFKSAGDLKAVVVPPTIAGLSTGRDIIDLTGVPTWTLNTATSTTVRVQRVLTSAEADTALPDSPHVTVYTSTVNGSTITTRPSSYAYQWTRAFVGEGLGTTDAGYTLPSVITSNSVMSTAEWDVPVVAAAAAIVRTSLYGARCDGLNAVADGFTDFDSNTWSNGGGNEESPLATPIFLVRLHGGCVWSANDSAEVATWRASIDSAKDLKEAFESMNPVLYRKDWLAQTADLWDRHATTPLTGQAVLGLALDDASAAAISNGESLLVCLSIDGTHFYSADVARATIAKAAARTSIAATTPSQWPLYLRGSVAEALAVNETGTALWMREVALVLEVLARPVDVAALVEEWGDASVSVSVTYNASSLERFQHAVAAQLGVEAGVVAVQVTPSGSVTMPLKGTPTESTSSSVNSESSGVSEESATAATSFSSSSASSSMVSLISFSDTTTVMAAAVRAVQTRQRQARAMYEQDTDTAVASAEPATAASPVLEMSTYAVTITILADAIAYNATAKTSALTSSPDLLYRAVTSLRSNVTGPTLLSTLMVDGNSVTSSHTAVQLYALTVNFTMSNGIDLHAISAGAALPTSPATEVDWRTRFLAIPYAALTADTVDPSKDNDTSSKVRWWAVPVMLLLPVCLIYGTYYVYKKYLRKSPEVTVENVT